MEIRAATENDIPAIVNLLKISLGESMMPKSETFWRWKHVDNPFGSSPVLLAIAGGEVVGVRAFMRWEWYGKNRVWKAVRAVDTATHPAHQGKGIFTKLTLALVAQCKREGTHFIFNTPNKQSRPGYLKMGWRDAGRMKVGINLRIPFGRRSPDDKISFDLGGFLNDSRLHPLLENHSGGQDFNVRTRYSSAYLKWRYLSNPNIRYFATGRFSDSSPFLIIFRVKSGKFGRELRVCDIFNGPDVGRMEMKESWRALVRSVQPSLVTFSATSGVLYLPHVVLGVGPRVTLMDLNDRVSEETCVGFTQWRPSLGDMEVF